MALKRKSKIIILLFMCLAIIGLYLGKNVYFKKASPIEKNNAGIKQENSSKKEIPDLNYDKPALLEFSTAT